MSPIFHFFQCWCVLRERGKDYLHIFVQLKDVVQIMGVYIHETVENVYIRGDILTEQILQKIEK